MFSQFWPCKTLFVSVRYWPTQCSLARDFSTCFWMTSQPAEVARAGRENWHSELLLPKMQGLPDFGFLGSLSLEHRPQEVKPGSKHRYDWDIPGDALNYHKKILQFGPLTSVVPQLSFTDSVVAKKGFASDDYSSCLLTWNLQVECLLKVKTKLSHSIAWCLKFWILWSY